MLFGLSTSLVRFFVVARIVVCSQGAFGRGSSDRPVGGNSSAEIASACLFFAIISAQSGSKPSRRQIRFPARGTGRARTPGAPPSILRTWDASDGSLHSDALG